MADFEDELKRALARESPPPNFDARVLAAIEQRQLDACVRSLPIWLGWIRNWRFAPIFAGALTLSAGAIYWQHERVEKGQAAKQKLIIAIHIAGSELQHARERVLTKGPEAKQ
jgi:hypothetical protein